MKNLSFSKKFKIVLSATLIVLVVGMILLGVLGLNKTVDYKDGYEAKISVEESIGDSYSIMKETTEKYFNENGIKYLSYQEEKDNGTVIYKFDYDVSEKINVENLEYKIVTAFSSDSTISGLDVSVLTYKTENLFGSQAGWIFLAAGLTLVAGFVFLCFREKIASALTVACVSVVTALTFIALNAILRIPMGTTFGIVTVVATLLSTMVSLNFVNKYSTAKNTVGTDKLSNVEIVSLIGKAELVKLISIFALLVVCGLLLVIFGGTNVKFIGLQIIVASIVSFFISELWTPMFWTFYKSEKKSKVSVKVATDK